jgi:serine/threonine protein kinase
MPDPGGDGRKGGAEAPAPRHLDRGEIGRGGMGVVHRVHDTRLLRDVAVKTLFPRFAGERRWIDAFVEEAQIAGQLEHPGILPIHDLGFDAAGVPRITMKLVRGRSLQAWLADEWRAPGSPERLGEGLEIFAKVCDAIAFAHSQGVIHRDLKPANIMVGQFGEVYVMDWGLARRLGAGEMAGASAGSGSRREGAVGTRLYMAPEQALGKTEDQDERTDVFALGSVLFEIVTGEAPYARASACGKGAEAAGEGAYTNPEEALGGVTVSGHILRVIKKALARAKVDRYASAAELKAEVQRFLRGGLHLPRRDFAPGTRIVVEGESGAAAYIVVRGHCVAYRTVGGEKRILRRMGPGDVFGEMAVLMALPRTATVEAEDAVTTIVVTASALEEGLGTDSWMGALVRALADRFRELDARASP